MKYPAARKNVIRLCLSAAACMLALVAIAAPASAHATRAAPSTGSHAPHLSVSGTRAQYATPQSLELLLELLGLSVQVSNGYIGASGPAGTVQVACALPLSETDGLGSLCVFSGDNETGNGLIFFPGDSVPASTCIYIYGTAANVYDNTNQSWDLGTVNGNCANGGTVDALDQSGQDENINPPVTEGIGFAPDDFQLGDPFPAEPDAAVFWQD